MRGHLAPFIALLLNRSLVTGCFPTEIEQAIVRPPLKKSGLDARKVKKTIDLFQIYRSLVSTTDGRVFGNTMA